MSTLEYIEMRLGEVVFGSPEHALLTQAKADLLAAGFVPADKEENSDA